MLYAPAKVQLAKYVSPDNDVGEYINLACERLINSGRWKGTLQRLAYQIDQTGILTLGRDYLTLEGTKVEDYSRPIANQWYEFLPGSDTFSQNYGSNVRAMGDGWATFRDIPTTAADTTYAADTPATPIPSYLAFRCPLLGADSACLVQGTGTDSQPIYGADGTPGETLTANGPASVNLFTTVAHVVKPITLGVATLVAIDPNTGIETVIGIYQPGETVPCYRRYFVQEASEAQHPNNLTNITAYCKRRFVPAVADNDSLFTDNLGALKNSLLSIHYEDAGDDVRAEKCMRIALKLLNDELYSYRSDNEQGAVRIRSGGQFGGSDIPQLM